MDRFDSRLEFPRIVFDGQVPFEHPDGKTGGSRAAYRFQWPDDAEKSCLPDHYRRLLDDVRLIPDDAYLKGVRHYAGLAQIERQNIVTRADTVIRSRCLKVSAAAANAALMLLADCVYDPETKFFSRGDTSLLFEHALQYRFWRFNYFRAGRGAVWDLADLSKLERYVDAMGSVPEGANEDARVFEVKQFLKNIREYEKEMEPKVAGPEVTGSLMDQTYDENALGFGRRRA